MTVMPTRARWHPFSLWHLLHEPRVITALHMLGYFVLAAGGVLALTSPPSSVKAEWGAHLTTAWGLSIALGGLVALISTPRGIWWGERIGITLLGVGAVMYASVVLSLHYAGPGNRLPQAAFILYAIVQFAVRWFRIRNVALDPTRGPNGYRPADPAH